MIITEAGIYDGMTDAEYHADPTIDGSLSTTGAKALLRSPAHYKWQIENRVEKSAFDVGHAAHALILGVGMEVAVFDHDSWRTKIAQEDRDNARLEGKVPMLEKDYAPIVAMAESVLAHPIARSLLEQPGKAEQSMFAVDPESGVWMRGRVDHLPDAGFGRTTMVDLKTADSADPDDFDRVAAKYGYFIQDPWYQRLLTLTRGDDLIEFKFLLVEKTAPYLVSVCELDSEFASIGCARMRRAIDTYKRCRDANDWPGYSEMTHLIGAPRWLAYEEEMEMVI